MNIKTSAKRALWPALAVFSFALQCMAVDRAGLDNRIFKLAAKLDAIQFKPDKRIPAEYLKKARGIVLLDRTKAGFVFGYQGGTGVALAKDPKTDKWGPVAFMSANEGSLGLQIGGERNFFVFLLVNKDAVQMLTDSKFELGGEARGTAGGASDGEEGKVSPDHHSVIVYSDRKGLYGGAAVKAGTLAPDNDANRVYYKQFLTLKDILIDKMAQPTEAALILAKKLDEYSQ
jgi:lipid-binding SYLF domain-containing protein